MSKKASTQQSEQHTLTRLIARPMLVLLLSSLAGFNLGIEAGQLLVAMLLAIVAIAIQRLRGNAGLEIARFSASLLAIGMGGFWFLQRVI